jgi:2-iminobutanoate/2-iminopropanoate deaminase
MDKIVKVNTYLSNMDEFVEMNTEYAKWFSGSFPARCCVQVARLPKDVKIEIECIALQ